VTAVQGKKKMLFGQRFTITFLGRQPECIDHTPGEPHEPCWVVTHLDQLSESDDDAGPGGVTQP